MTQTNEKRRARRMPAKGEAVLPQEWRANFRDVSVGGARLCLLGGSPPTLGEAFSAHVLFDSEPPLEITAIARVAWTEHIGSQWEMGVHFEKMDGITESDLRRMLDLIDPPGGEPLEGIHMELRKIA